MADKGVELLPIYGQRKCSDVSGGSDMIEAKQGYLSLRRAARKIGQVYGWKRLPHKSSSLHRFWRERRVHLPLTSHSHPPTSPVQKKTRNSVFPLNSSSWECVCMCVCLTSTRDLGCTIPLISAVHTRSSMPSGRRRRSFHKVTPWWLLSASQTSGRDLQQNIYYCQAAERVSPKTYGDHDGFSGARCRRKSEGGERAKWQNWQLDETQK